MLVERLLLASLSLSSMISLNELNGIVSKGAKPTLVISAQSLNRSIVRLEKSSTNCQVFYEAFCGTLQESK